jgi:hypothetical protein
MILKLATIEAMQTANPNDRISIPTQREPSMFEYSAIVAMSVIAIRNLFEWLRKKEDADDKTQERLINHVIEENKQLREAVVLLAKREACNVTN